MTAQINVPHLRSVKPEGTLDEFNEWLSLKIREALETEDEVEVTLPDGSVDIVRLNEDGELQADSVPTPEMEPIPEEDED